METKERIKWIDYAKAFACFLVVLGHLIQSFQKCGIDNYTYVTTFINWFVYLFHTALFMCMSGFLYCKDKKDFSWQSYKKFEYKKIINLLVPYITFYLLFIGINVLFSSSVNEPKGIEDLMGIFNNPISPYWFLYALLSIFIAIPILEKMCKNNSKVVLGILFVLKIVSIFFQTNIYFIDSIMKHAIYFYLGCFIQTENKRKNQKINLLSAGIFIIISYGIYIIKNSMHDNIYEIIKVFLSIAGIYISVIIFRNIKKSRILDTFEKYTFQIYLLHTIFAAGIRIVLLKLGIENYALHMTLGLLFSIYVPVIVSKLSEKIKYTEFFFYPLKTIEHIKERRLKDGREKA